MVKRTKTRPTKARPRMARPQTRVKEAVARHSHGGRRAGAGRKPKNGVAGVGHDTRVVLATPREVRNALVYVLANGKKHAAEGREVQVPAAIDTFTSAPWFDGFRDSVHVRRIESLPRPVTDARTWLLTLGWRHHGLLSIHDLPATA